MRAVVASLGSLRAVVFALCGCVAVSVCMSVGGCSAERDLAGGGLDSSATGNRATIDGAIAVVRLIDLRIAKELECCSVRAETAFAPVDMSGQQEFVADTGTLDSEAFADALASVLSESEIVIVYWTARCRIDALIDKRMELDGLAGADAGRIERLDNAVRFLRTLSSRGLFLLGSRRTREAESGLVSVLFDPRFRFDTQWAEDISRAFFALGVADVPALTAAPPSHAVSAAQEISSRLKAVYGARKDLNVK